MLATDDFLEHFGVKGMKWGQRKANSASASSGAPDLNTRKGRLAALKNRELKSVTVTTKNGETVELKETKNGKLANHIASLSKSNYHESLNYSSFELSAGGRKVGDAAFSRESKDELNLVWLGVKSKERGNGYGSAAFDSAVKYGKSVGVKTITLEVPTRAKDARHIYEKRGFVVNKERVVAEDHAVLLTPMKLDLDTVPLKHAEDNMPDVESDELERAFEETFGPSLEDDAEHSALGDFLAHYGVKGQKWGVRKDQHREYREADTRDTTNMVKRAGSSAQMTRYFATGGKLKKQQKYTEEWYDKLEGGKEYIEKGAKMSRVVRGVDDRALQGNLYVSRLKSDNEMYKAVIPAVQKKFAFGQKEYHTVYQVELEAKRRMAMPSQKERVDMFIEAIQTPVGRQWMKDNGYKKEIDELNAKEMGLKAYKKFNKYAGDQSSALNQQYFNTVKKRGYDALIDDNDAGIWSKKPTIIVGGPSAVKVTSVRQLSADEINAAQRNVLRDRDFKAKNGGT